MIGLDMTPEMVERARRNATDAGLANVEVREGLIEQIPLPDASVTWSSRTAFSTSRRARAASWPRYARVLRPGGRISIADLVLDDALPEDVLKSPAALAG